MAENGGPEKAYVAEKAESHARSSGVVFFGVSIESVVAQVAEDQIQYGEIIIFHRGWLYITDAEKDRIVRWGTGHR